jgi:ABC-type transport system involved in cytochrome bd biosynthesis fused ATPase/permease subunit
MSGSLRVGGDALDALDLVSLRRHVAYLPQRPHLGEAHVSVRTALGFSCSDAGDDAMTGALGRVRLLEALRLVHQGDPLEVRVGELSAGQRQRLALARVLLQDRDVVILDEPDANLDREGIVLVAALANELAKQGKMVAIAAHSAELATLSASTLTLESSDTLTS